MDVQMDLGTFWYMLTGLVFLAVMVWLIRRDGTGKSAADAATQMTAAAAVAFNLVSAAEQLWTTGRLPKDGRLEWVMAQLAALFPRLDETQLRATVEAAVYWLKMMQVTGAELDETLESSGLEF